MGRRSQRYRHRLGRERLQWPPKRPERRISSAEPKQRGTNGGIEPQGRKWREKRYALHQLLPVEIN